MEQVTNWLQRNLKQDDFRDDWYGYLTNQVGHVALGFLVAWAVSMAWFWIAGEMPYKRPAWVVCLVLYLAFEAARGWNGSDSLEDTIYTAAYGSGGAFLAFSEITVGDTTLAFNSREAFSVLAIIVLHLLYGVSKRWPR